MKSEKYIEDFVAEEKQIASNPFLSTRILSEIESGKRENRKKTPLILYVVFAISIVLVAFAGINIGKAVIPQKSNQEISLNINDAQIENISLYNIGEYAN